MQVKLGNHTKHSFQSVLNGQNNGGKFVVYQTIYPLPLFRPIRRLSKVYYIEPGEDPSTYKGKYNTITSIIGWWGLPFGPTYSMKAIKLNNEGGIDVTDDIYLNITETQYNNGAIDIVQNATKFQHPDKGEIKEFKKVFEQLLEEGTIESLPIIGFCIDTEKGVPPFYLIGLKTTPSSVENELITKGIYKRFYKQLIFEIVGLNSEFKNKPEFIEQGFDFNRALQ